MRPIAAVLFDADGVVQQPPADWLARVGELCGRADQADAFVNQVFAAERPCLDGSSDFRAALTQVLEQWQSAIPVEQALQVWTQIDTDREILSLVADVRGCGISVALATNQQPYRAAFMTEALGYRDQFDHLLYSCELGCAKPSAGYFQAALARLGVAPANALFLDDHEQNVAAARDCGLKAERFHREEGVARLAELLSGHGIDITVGGNRS